MKRQATDWEKIVTKPLSFGIRNIQGIVKSQQEENKQQFSLSVQKI